MESRIQDCLGLPYTGQWFPSPVGGEDLYSLIYRVCTLFWTEFTKIKEVHKNFLAPIRRQNGGDRLELVWWDIVLRGSSHRSVLFFVPYFCARLDFPSPPLSAPGSPRMHRLHFSRTLNFYFNIERLSRWVRTLYVRHISMCRPKGKLFGINLGFWQEPIKFDRLLFLRNCPPTPPLRQHFALNEK